MRPLLLLTILIVMSNPALAQSPWKTENGAVSFFSHAPLEDILAETKKAAAAFDAATGDVAVLIPIKSFEFDKSLMQEHFNENYLESDKFPDATFLGKITGPFPADTEKSFATTAKGKLTIHGIAQQRDIPVALKRDSGGLLWVSGKFTVKMADHKIKIPRLLFQNIAEEVEVSFEFLLKTSGI